MSEPSHSPSIWKAGHTMLDSIANWIIGIGVVFDLFGCIGLVRLPDVYNRAQAATKCVTLGTCFILFGVILRTGDAAMGIKAAICIAFVLLTSPVAAHAICRAAYISGVKLWDGSVEDAFAERAQEIKKEQASEGPLENEEA